jgi:hypothetical protein
MKPGEAKTLRLKGFADREKIVVTIDGKEIGSVNFNWQGIATLPLPADLTAMTITLGIAAEQGRQTPRISEVRLCK